MQNTKQNSKTRMGTMRASNQKACMFNTTICFILYFVLKTLHLFSIFIEMYSFVCSFVVLKTRHILVEISRHVQFRVQFCLFAVACLLACLLACLFACLPACLPACRSCCRCHSFIFIVKVQGNKIVWVLMILKMQCMASLMNNNSAK